MTKATKLTRFTMAGMMVCSMALTTLTSVSAVAPKITSAATKTDENLSDKLPSAVTVKVHKLKFLDADSSQKPNTGAEINYPGAVAVEGVQFALYNIRALVDEEVKALREDNNQLTEQEAINLAVKNISYNWTSKKGELLPSTTVTTDSRGVAQFDNLATKTGEKYNIYLAEELSGDNNSNMFISLPLIFGMPIKNDKNQYYKVVNLYAKNSAIDKEITNLGEGDSSDNAVYNYEVGEEVHYDARVNIPANIAERKSESEYLYSHLSIEDKMSTVGTTFKQIDSITAGADDVTAQFNAFGFDITAGNGTEEAGFKFHVPFDTDKQTELAALLSAIAGKQLKISYTVAINEFAVPTQDIGNEFKVDFNNKPIVDTATKIETGGHKFTKIDSSDHDHKLAGATFKISRVRNNQKEYATFDNQEQLISNEDGVYTANDITWTSIGTTFTTGSSSTNTGNLEFRGLEAGDYQLEEISAPTGYAKSETPLPFSITKGANGTLELNTANNLYKAVENTPIDGVLPITGSMGIAAFLIVGTAAMGTAVLIKKRRA